MSDSRFPYTYACDLMREQIGPQITRSDASKIRVLISDVLGIDDEELAIKLADRYKEIIDERIYGDDGRVATFEKMRRPVKSEE